MMADISLEERVVILESQLETLQQRFEECLPVAALRSKGGWKAIVGTFADDPLYEEAMQLGRAWRENQFDETSADGA